MGDVREGRGAIPAREGKMTATVDARGLACPLPVIMAKKAMEAQDRINVLVDNVQAVENIRRLAVKTACGFAVTEKEGGCWEIVLTRTGPPGDGPTDGPAAAAHPPICHEGGRADAAPLVVVLADERMGQGDDILGGLLIRGFIHALLQLDPRPARIVCYNAGVRLTLADSAVLDDLRDLEESGTEILICGACADFFGVMDRVAVGRISNMYDIVEILAAAGRVVRP
ncbi:MAG: sulfurtransferase-like selenium metabolism protein YedF [Pseudomonadota bacterium]|nr:sulfurtransferase-like selenium metabolism protein YedF [Pseudomonadota bacterium]